MVRVGGLGGWEGWRRRAPYWEGDLFTSYLLLHFNVILAPRPVNTPAFPFPSGARGAEDRTERGARILGESGGAPRRGLWVRSEGGRV